MTTLLLLAALALRGRFVFGFVVLAAIAVPIERVFALHPQRVFRRRWRTDVVHFCVNNVLILAGLTILLAPFVVGIRAFMPADLQAAVRSQPQWLQFFEAFLIAEVCSYWSHRASHKVPWLWRFHAVHHSIEEMDWLAAARLHPLDQVFRQTCVLLPIYALGFSKLSFGGVLILFSFQAIFIHANVRFTFGPLHWIVATPLFHHWHHGNEPGAYNSNFAAELPVLDLIFGTLNMPNGWPADYGVDASLPEHYLDQLAMPFRH